MKVLHTLICFFFLSLQDEHTDLVNAITVYPGTEGGDVTVQCRDSKSDHLKLFCKQNCRAKNILIETADVKAQRGKYSIEWKNDGRYIWGEVFVTITQLNKSDSGWYWCGYNESGYIHYVDIQIIVVDALLDGKSSEGKSIFTRTGGNILVACNFSRSFTWKSFCKEECEGQNILVETTNARVQRGRYSIGYIQRSSSGGIMYVSISQLTKSDSGRYRCVQGRLSFPHPYKEFNIVVTDDSITSKPVFHTSSSASTATTTQSSDSDQQQNETTEFPGTWLYVGLTLAVVTVLLSAAVFIYCRKRSAQHKETPMESEYNFVSQTSQVYEDIREDRQRPPPPVEISPLYTNAKYTKPHGVETSDDFCDITAARSQNTAENNLSELTYSEFNFSQPTAGSSSSVLPGRSEEVIYSVPRTERSSYTSHADLPVYSTILSRQQRAEVK